MRSKLIPGKLKPISFILVLPLILITVFLTNSAFDYFEGKQLEKLESAKVVKQAEVFEPFYPLSNFERSEIEKVVYAESGNQGLEGQMAVAQTIHDRSVLWNMPVLDVINQPGQFAHYNGQVPQQVCESVSAVFDYGVLIFDEPITHFHSGDAPYWAADKECRGMIRDHKFYY